MKTSCIRYPEQSIIVVRRDWQMKMLNENRAVNPKKRDTIADCAAEMMSIFEFHYNNRFANRVLRQAIERFKGMHSKLSIPTGDWMPYPITYLRELLLNSRSPSNIMAATELLEKKMIISLNCPTDIQKYYVSNNATWLRFNPDVVNEWIDRNCKKTWVKGWQADPDPNAVVIEAPAEIDPKAEAAKMLSLLVENICEYHRHVHAKNKNTVYDPKRQERVRFIIEYRRKLRGKDKKLLFTDDEIIGQCAQAILGNRFSEFHQGGPDGKGKTYDDINLIFRANDKFENQISYAEVKNITVEMALRDFRGFLAGEPSRWSKSAKQIDSGASMAKREVFKPLDAKLRERYRDFGRAVAGFFLTNTPVAEVIEFTKTNHSLKKIQDGLADPNILEVAIEDALKVFRPEIEESTRGIVKEFCKTFCKLQAINS